MRIVSDYFSDFRAGWFGLEDEADHEGQDHGDVAVEEEVGVAGMDGAIVHRVVVFGTRYYDPDCCDWLSGSVR